jgi:pyruvate/2-oxoglutarate dehydrogenase complex dihydrolipoamide dehydrogenase (E3) component
MSPETPVAQQPDPSAASPTSAKPPAQAVGRPKIACDLAVVGCGTVALEAARAAIRRRARVVLVYQGSSESAAKVDPWLLSRALDLVQQEPALAPRTGRATTTESAPPTGALGLLQRALQSATRTAEDCAVEDLARAGAEVVHGSAIFTGLNTLKAGSLEVQFGHAILAPGSVATRPEFVVPEGDAVLTEATLGRLEELPQRLAVFGSNRQACQWARLFRRLGCEVHLIDRDYAILSEEDPLISAIVEAQLRRNAIRLQLGCQDIRIETMRQRRAIVIDREDGKEKLLVDEIFWCGPRRLETAGLGLEAAGVVYTDRAILVNDALQTTNRRIYVAGEGCGARYGGALAAQATVRTAVRNALAPLGGLVRQRFDWHLVPRGLYNDPEIIQIGLTHHEIAAWRSELDTYRQVLATADRASGESALGEFIEVVVNRSSGRIASVTAVAEKAEEWIAPLQVLMARRLPLAALADVVSCYPSRLELLKRVADRYLADYEARYGTGWQGQGRALWERLVRGCRRIVSGRVRP